jgi:hypothetical protein
MPARGSAIGASWGQSVFGGTGGATGRPVSPTTGAVYPAQGAISGGYSNSANTWSAPVKWLLVLVFLEVAALAGLRHGFRHHHGG